MDISIHYGYKYTLWIEVHIKDISIHYGDKYTLWM